MDNFPAYLTDALTRFAEECRAEGRSLAQAELRGQMASLLGFEPQQKSLVNSGVPPKVEKPSYGYGVIAKVVRDVMIDSPRNGLLITDIVTRATRDFHTPMTAAMARNALRRMKQHGEVVCRRRSRWIATDKLRGTKDANEKGALNGQTASAPIAGEGSPLHQFRQPTLGLAG